MPGPSYRSKVSLRKAHLHHLTNGTEYTITTSRDSIGNAQIAFMAFLFKGKERSLLLKVDELAPSRSYSVSFKANGSGESLLLTWWHRKGRKWIQINGEKID